MAGNYQQLLSHFKSGENVFTFFAYEDFSKENFVMSPLAAQLIFTVAYLGAKKETAEIMRFALGCEAEKETKIWKDLKTLMMELEEEEPQYKILLHFIVTDKYGIEVDFKTKAEEILKNPLIVLNSSTSVETLSFLNTVIREQTEGTIQRAIEPKMINKKTNIILNSVASFKALWLEQFDMNHMDYAEFITGPKEAVCVWTLTKYGCYDYYEDENLDCQFIKIPFENDSHYMTIICPNTFEGMKRVEDNLDLILKPTLNFRNVFMKLHLPKFKIESKLNFKRVLQKLCRRQVFSKERADFTGISRTKERLFINALNQTAFISVNENGTNIDASELDDTTKSRKKTSRKCFYSRNERTAPKIKINRPFIFYITVEDLIVFIGKVTDPSKKDDLKKKVEYSPDGETIFLD